MTCSENNNPNKCLICNLGFAFKAQITVPNTCVKASSATCDTSCVTCSDNGNAYKCRTCYNGLNATSITSSLENL